MHIFNQPRCLRVRFNLILNYRCFESIVVNDFEAERNKMREKENTKGGENNNGVTLELLVS